MALPDTLRFGGLGKTLGGIADRPLGGSLCFYRKIAVRKPLKGEWYVSGAIPMAYKAPNDLTSTYLVVVPTYYARSATVPGEAVKL